VDRDTNIVTSLSSITRKRKAALREIADQLQQLSPLAPKLGLNDDESCSLEELLKRVKSLPEFSNWLQVKDLQDQRPATAVSKAEHTLKIPLPSEQTDNTEFLCLTRIAQEKWTLYRNKEEN
jgi:hypothetical protein